MGKTFVYNTGKEEAPKEEIWKEYGLFFDGTLNNKDNTELREKVLEKKTATPLEIKIYKAGSHRSFKQDQGTDNSYSNDYTNVARLWQYCEKDYRIYVAGIGTLSKAQDDDDGFMFGAGKTGIRQKVRKGCEDLALKLGIIKRNQDRLDKNKKITRITLDVFGFSRGAAAARNFVHEVNVKDAYMPDGYLEHKMKQDHEKRQQENYEKRKKYEQNGGVVAVQDNLKSKPMLYIDAAIRDSDGEHISEHALKDGLLPKMGHFGYMLLQNGFSLDDIKNLEVIIRFVGVYDTVSSYYKEVSMKKFVIDQLKGDPRVNKYFGDDVSELNLKNLGRIHKAVHFTAMNEHRYNFPLTNFPGALEKTFPGVHSDVGGSYLSGIENVDEIEVGFTPSYNAFKLNEQQAAYLLKRGFWGDDAKSKLKNYRENLIDQCWFKEDQLYITDINTFKYKGKDSPLPKSLSGGYDKLTGVRDLRKEYSYIPLLFMNAHFKKILGLKYTKILPLETKLISVFSVDSFPVLKKAKDHLKPYVMDDKGGKWDFLSPEHIKLKNEIFLKKKRKFLEKAQEEAKKSKREEFFPPAQRDGYLESVHREAILKGKIFEKQIQKRIDETEARQIKLQETQGVLEILRNEYLHWSANKDWFGMNPKENRRRTEL